MQEDKKITVIELENPAGEWIGNISIDLETMEIQSHLKYGYKVREDKSVME